MVIVVKDMRLKNSQPCIGIRHVQVLMMFIGVSLAFASTVTMSLAIVAMTDPNNDDSFNWSIKRQSVILSSFNWGNIILQGFSGELAARFGGMTLAVMCIGVNSVVSLLLPVMAMYGDWILICVCRGVQGMTQGAMFPAIHYLISKWIPIDEKSRMTSFIYAGSQLGLATQLFVSGYIADYWGWQAIFYVNACAGGIWTAAYLILGSDSPQAARMISKEERLYIQSSLGQIGGHKKLKTPWRSIFTSVPFIAVTVANIGSNWGFWTLMTEIPTYMSNVLGVNIKKNGIMSALPFLTMFIMSFPVGCISDYVLKKKLVSLTVCRKICNSIGFFGPAVGLICLSYLPAGYVMAAVLLLVVSLGLHTGFLGGFIIVYLDLAPNFAGTLMAVASFFANFIALFAPLAVGFILEDETNPVEWRVVFYITAGLYIFTNLIYVIFGTSKRQKWNDATEQSPENEIKV